MCVRRTLLPVVCVLFLLITPGSVAVSAQPPFPNGSVEAAADTIPYSGQLNDVSGSPVADGAYDFTFSLYDAPDAGRLLWSETQSGVTTQVGSFATALGAANPLPKEVLEGKELWLAIGLRAAGETTFTELAPRQLLDANAPGAVTALTCPHSHFTDNWGGSNGMYGLRIENTSSSGDGLRVLSDVTTADWGAVYAVNRATTGLGSGVVAKGTAGTGLHASSVTNDGLEATTSAPLASNKSAVYAHAIDANGVWGISTNRAGVHGQSGTRFGVEAVGGGDGSASDLMGDLSLGGNLGEIFAGGDIAGLYSNGYVTFDLDNDNNAPRQLEVWNGTDTLVYKVDESGNTTAIGTKSAAVQTEDYGERLLYSLESPEVWFEDIGSSTLKDGQAKVDFDPIFLQAANLETAYHVFLTPVCEEPAILTVSAKSPTGFTVKGVTLREQPSNCGFDYRVVAKRQGFEGVRLERADSQPNSRSGEVQQ